MKTFKSNQTKFKTILSCFAIALFIFSCSQEDETLSLKESDNLIEEKSIDTELLSLEDYALLAYNSTETNIASKPSKDKGNKVDIAWAKGKSATIEIPSHFKYGVDVIQIQNYQFKYINGKSNGTFELSDFDSNNLLEKISGKIISATFEDDAKTVRFTGLITSSTNDSTLVGKFVIWTAEDNGTNKNIDRTTDIRYGIPEFVANLHESQGFPEAIFSKNNVVSGDFQLKIVEPGKNKTK